jgi:hypothetical protein
LNIQTAGALRYTLPPPFKEPKNKLHFTENSEIFEDFKLPTYESMQLWNNAQRNQ